MSEKIRIITASITIVEKDFKKKDSKSKKELTKQLEEELKKTLKADSVSVSVSNVQSFILGGE